MDRLYVQTSKEPFMRIGPIHLTERQLKEDIRRHLTAQDWEWMYTLVTNCKTQFEDVGWVDALVYAIKDSRVFFNTLSNDEAMKILNFTMLWKLCKASESARRVKGVSDTIPPLPAELQNFFETKSEYVPEKVMEPIRMTKQWREVEVDKPLPKTSLLSKYEAARRKT